jgi:hypothetical protein
MEGCNHPNPNFDDPGLFMPSVAKYQENLQLLVGSQSETSYLDLRAVAQHGKTSPC